MLQRTSDHSASPTLCSRFSTVLAVACSSWTRFGRQPLLPIRRFQWPAGLFLFILAHPAAIGAAGATCCRVTHFTKIHTRCWRPLLPRRTPASCRVPTCPANFPCFASTVCCIQSPTFIFAPLNKRRRYRRLRELPLADHLPPAASLPGHRRIGGCCNPSTTDTGAHANELLRAPYLTPGLSSINVQGLPAKKQPAPNAAGKRRWRWRWRHSCPSLEAQWPLS